jgi:hypothetical protein
MQELICDTRRHLVAATESARSDSPTDDGEARASVVQSIPQDSRRDRSDASEEPSLVFENIRPARQRWRAGDCMSLLAAGIVAIYMALGGVLLANIFTL